ncbi:unnamed protein product, partial [Mesorhabditis belari]|uniref:SH3 domain-containing protein n=1 Tax=Mesorhabditis belari TaxID=2138241 RepID=A0AAF3FEB9_9BILA
MREPVAAVRRKNKTELPQEIPRSPLNEVAVASALFDNESEYPNELAFKQGDTLRIVDNGSDVDGWLLCVDVKGKRGFAPANRLKVMNRFENDPFFQHAHPLFDDFFMFRNEDRGAFDDPFFDRAPRLFSANPSRMTSPAPSMTSIPNAVPPVRRLSSMNDAYQGVVRNIPIRLEQGSGESRIVHTDDAIGPQAMRRTMSAGRVSPPVPPTRKYFNIAPPPQLATQPQTSSSDEDDAQRTPTLRNPSYDFVSPLREDRPSSDLSNMENLAQRLKQIARPYRSSFDGSDFPSERRSQLKSVQPQSSFEAEQTGQEKRVSDSSTISGCSSDPNTSISEQNNSEDSGHGSLSGAPIKVEVRSSNLTRPIKFDNDDVPSSTSVLETVFDNLDKLIPKNVRNVPIVTKEPPAIPPKPVTNWKVPIHVEEDIRKNDSPHWNKIPTHLIEEPAPTPKRIDKLNDLLDDEMLSRKRAVVTQLADSLRSIELSVQMMNKATAPQFWRAPHVLQVHLPALKEACQNLHEQTELFVDTTARISIDSRHPKADELRRLVTPLRDTRGVITGLRRQLDSSGWKLAVLARDKEQPRTGMDALEQLIHIAKQIPNECRSLWDWSRSLSPSTAIVFLGGPAKIPPFPTHFPSTSQLNAKLKPVDEDEKRLSTSSSSTLTSGDSSPSAASSSSLHSNPTANPPSILVTNKTTSNRGRVKFVDQKPDPQPLATSSPSNSNDRNSLSPSETESERETPIYSEINKFRDIEPPHLVIPSISQERTGSTPSFLSSPSGSTAVMEEDDLESVNSDRESLYQDYAILDDLFPERKKENKKKIEERPRIVEEDREFIKLSAPQFDQHVTSLSTAIDEFLNTVEMHRPPREFVHRGKLVILWAHKLVYLGDSLSDGLHAEALKATARLAANRLCDALQECVAHTKTAADEYPDVTCMQTMVDSVMSVARSAQDLKRTVVDWQIASSV